MLFNCSFNVVHSSLQFSALINSLVMNIFLHRALSAVLDDFFRVDFQNLNSFFKEMNIFKAPFQAFAINSIKITFHSPILFSLVLSYELSLFHFSYCNNHSIYILEERRKAGVEFMGNLCKRTQICIHPFIHSLIKVSKTEERNRALG